MSSPLAYINQCGQEKAPEVSIIVRPFNFLVYAQVVHQVIDGICGRESVRFEQCAKMLTASQYGQLKQSLAQLAKESVNRNFNKADVSVYAYTDREHELYTRHTHDTMYVILNILFYLFASYNTG